MLLSKRCSFFPRFAHDGFCAFESLVVSAFCSCIRMHFVSKNYFCGTDSTKMLTKLWTTIQICFRCRYLTPSHFDCLFNSFLLHSETTTFCFHFPFERMPVSFVRLMFRIDMKHDEEKKSCNNESRAIGKKAVAFAAGECETSEWYYLFRLCLQRYFFFRKTIFIR